MRYWIRIVLEARLKPKTSKQQVTPYGQDLDQKLQITSYAPWERLKSTTLFWIYDMLYDSCLRGKTSSKDFQRISYAP